MMTKQEAFEQLNALKDYYESTGAVFVLCLQVPEQDGAWLFYNRLQESKTKALVKTIEKNVNLHFDDVVPEVKKN